MMIKNIVTAIPQSIDLFPPYYIPNEEPQHQHCSPSYFFRFFKPSQVTQINV